MIERSERALHTLRLTLLLCPADKQKNINEPNSKDSSLESHNERNEDDLKTKELQGHEGIGFDGDVEDSDVEVETHYYPASSENRLEREREETVRAAVKNFQQRVFLDFQRIHREREQRRRAPSLDEEVQKAANAEEVPAELA